MGEVTEFSVEGQAAVITLNRPDRLNALSPQLRDELTEALARVQEDDTIRVAILTGAANLIDGEIELAGDQAMFHGENGIVIPLALVVTGSTSIFRYLRRSVLDFDGVKRLEQRLTEPEIWNDPEEAKKIQRERSRLQEGIAADGELGGLLESDGDIHLVFFRDHSASDGEAL